MYMHTRSARALPTGYPVNAFVSGLGSQDSVSRGTDFVDQQMAQARATFSQQMAPILQKLTKDMEKKVQDQVAATTAAILALNAIPVIGNIAAAIASVAASLSGDKYQTKIQEVMADFQRKTQELAVDYELKAKDEITLLIKSIEDNAIKLALSGAVLPPPDPEVPMEGLGIHKKIKKLGRSINRAVSKIGREIGRPFEQAWDAIEQGLNVLSGKAAYLKARDAAANGWIIAQRSYKTAYGEILKEIRSPQYKNDLTIDMARSIRSDPDIQNLIEQKRIADQESIRNAQEIRQQAERATKTNHQYDAYKLAQADPSLKKIKAGPIVAAAAIPIVMALIT